MFANVGDTRERKAGPVARGEAEKVEPHSTFSADKSCHCTYSIVFYARKATSHTLTYVKLSRGEIHLILAASCYLRSWTWYGLALIAQNKGFRTRLADCRIVCNNLSWVADKARQGPTRQIQIWHCQITRLDLAVDLFKFPNTSRPVEICFAGGRKIS